LHARVAHTGLVGAQGHGWQQLLASLHLVRSTERPPRNVYYYGMVTPAPTIQGYCGGGCVAGLGPVPSQTDDYSRGSVGIGYPGAQAITTILHETGHALGRPHSPCGTQDAAPGYPYPGADIGSWGYDLLAKALKAPGQTKDVMGYCQPIWVSDFTYERMFQRIAYANANPYLIASPDPERAPGRFLVLAIEADGRLEWQAPVDLDESPLGELYEVALFDAAGAVVQRITGIFYPVNHLAGGLLLVRQDRVSMTPGARALSPVGLSVRSLPL
jgi:hypothetical protein